MDENKIEQFRKDFIDLLDKYDISAVEVVESPLNNFDNRPEIAKLHEKIVFIAKDGRHETDFPSFILVKDFKLLTV